MDPSIYALAVLVALAICALATIVSARPQRPCPRCDVRTALAARRPLHAIGTRGLPWLEIDFPEDYRRALDQVLPQIERDLHSPRIARSA